MARWKTFAAAAAAALLLPWTFLFAEDEMMDEELGKWSNSTASALFDDVRKERPPRPTGEASDIRFPNDFLTPSVPSEEAEDEEEEPEPAAEAETEPEHKNDTEVSIAVVLSLAIFGIFTWTDYRYRQTIQQILAKNRRLIEGEEVDIDSALIGTPALAGVSGLGAGGGSTGAGISSSGISGSGIGGSGWDSSIYPIHSDAGTYSTDSSTRRFTEESSAGGF